MNDYAKKKSGLASEQQALSIYLEALLEEVPDEIVTEEVTPVIAREVLIPPVIAPAEVVPVVEDRKEVAVQVQAQAQEAVTVEEKPVEPENDVPAYADKPFEALLFKVCGVKLAVPLKELNGILEWPETITEMPGHSPWFIGIMKNLNKNVNLIDTALIVVPEKMRAGFPADPAERSNRVVLIGNGQWGLVCDSVEEVITLEPASVRWRTSRTKRRWLAGTVIEHMSALIDPEEFAVLLTSDEVGISA